ncbi:hypothetical protein BURMUCGD1_4612 [Burkholderia multivorans CGD1]|nr:hypothetical protein BURMUCGD1_4612 [Burkholderia multivorans CGD1]
MEKDASKLGTPAADAEKVISVPESGRTWRPPAYLACASVE